MRILIVVVGMLALLCSCGVSESAPAAQAPATASVATIQPQPVATGAAATEEPTAMASSPESATPEPTEAPATAQPTRADLQGAPLETPQPAGTSAMAAVPAGLEAVVDGARADLASKKSVALADVEVVEVRSVVWPDGGLGCPKPGMVYPQVQVDGILIRLRIGAQIFSYHGGGRRAPFLCEQSLRATPLAQPSEQQ